MKKIIILISLILFVGCTTSTKFIYCEYEELPFDEELGVARFKHINDGNVIGCLPEGSPDNARICNEIYRDC